MKNIYIVKDKKSFITSLPPLTNIKVMTLKELEDRVLGTYNNEARTYLYYEKNIPLNLIDVYLETFKYLNDKDINEKITKLNNIKRDLVNKHLYFYDEIFINSLKNTSITFKDFFKNKHLDRLISYLKDKCEVKVNYLEEKKTKYQVHEYNSLEDEVDDVIYRVMSLLDQGINLNNIKLMNVNSEYYPVLNRILNQYHLPFINLYDSNYDTSNYVLNFIHNLNTIGVTESIKLLNNEDYDVSILNIINSYAYLDDIEKAKDFIIKDLKNIKINKLKKDNYLELVDTSYQIKKEDYVFFLNFNNGNAPTIYDDSDLLTDEEYDLLGELNSSLKTNLKENELIDLLENCYYISYKNISLSQQYLPSYLVKKYDYIVIKENNKNHVLTDHKYYSDEVEKYNYALSRDHYKKTNEKTKKYECLAYNFKNKISQKNYDFKGLDKDKLRLGLKNKLNLSYSSLNTYYKCKFQYYLNSIIGLNKYENTLATIRGNVFHKLLEDSEKEDFDYDKIFEEEISSFKETDNEIRFFSSLIKDEFYLVKKFNEELRDSSQLKNILHEYKINFHEDIDGYDVGIIGFIDKIMYDDNHIALLDFKSGSSAKFKLDNLYYGLDIQLPMYAYFISKDKELSKKQIAGLYLQYIYRHYNDAQLENVEECNKGYRLEGYTNDALLDVMTDDKKKFIAHSKSNYSSLIMNNISKFTENKIHEAIDGIINADFTINPHTINKDKDTDSCHYCPFKDICYFKGDKKDYLPVKPDLFLGEVDDYTILLNCLDDLKNESINNQLQELINSGASKDDLKTFILDSLLKEPSLNEKTISLLKFIKKRKESE